MRKAKKSALLTAVAAAVLALAGSRARADFAISAVRVDLDAVNPTTTNGNGPITGNFGLVEFFAENLGASGVVNQGSRLTTVTVTMSDSGSGNLVVGGYTGSGTPSASAAADLFGANEIAVSGGGYIFKELNTSTTGAPKYVSAVNMLGDPTVSGDNNPQQAFNSFQFTPANAFSNYGYAMKSFTATYGSQTGGVNATTANGGKGALFAVAVVPVADSVNVQGQLGGDLQNVNPTNFNYTSTVIPGDLNFDHSVNFSDLGVLGQHYQTAGQSWSTGDLNGDGSVNFNDLGILGQNYGRTSPSAVGAAVPAPEPGILGLVGIGLIPMLRRRRVRQPIVNG